MNFFLLFIPHCWVIGSGALSIEEIGVAPLVGIHYLIEISERFLIRETIEYWQKGYKETEGTKSKECVFSCLSFNETAFLKLNKWEMEFKIGPGIGIHLLKNRVEERSEYGSWVITEYYSLNSYPVGFHIEVEAGHKFSKISLSGGARFGIIFLSPGEENLFYTRGNIREIVYLVNVSF